MVMKTEEKKEESRETKDIFRVWGDSYAVVSKMWEDSYTNLYRPWLESTEEMLDKALLLAKDATPEKYQEFYEEWMKTYQNTFNKFYPMLSLKPGKETLEKFLASAEESNKLYRSWISQSEENSKKTREILQEEADPAKYKECYDMWMKSYEKIFNDLLEMPARESTKEIFGNYNGIPEIYLDSFVQMLKLWKNSYAQLYGPHIESMVRVSGKMAEISRGNACPETYKEFYDLWVDTYKETYGRYIQSMHPSKEVFDNFEKSTGIYLNIYKSWTTALEKMSEKARELSKQTADPETSKEFYNLWIRMYEKATTSFFEDMPTIGPMKEMMEPVKNATRVYADTFSNMSRMWVKSGLGFTSKV